MQIVQDAAFMALATGKDVVLKDDDGKLFEAAKKWFGVPAPEGELVVVSTPRKIPDLYAEMMKRDV